MKTSDFDYNLPQDFIAQNPVSPRHNSKLLVFDSKTDKVFHKKFFNIAEFLMPGDVLVVNRSKVIKARILFKLGDKLCEIFLLRCVREREYKVLVRPGKAFKEGTSFNIDKTLKATVKKILEDGTRIVVFDYEGDLEKKLEQVGNMPLPPYIKNSDAEDNRYQTVYAKEKGSVAAPTAGLHFTEDLIAALKAKGVIFAELVLHVGLGTFLPVKSENIEDHNMHSEFFEFPGETADTLNSAKSQGRRIIAIGTTSVRVLESSYEVGKGFVPTNGETDIFIYPGSYSWKAVDGLITNFHLPKSTLLMLVASFLENKGWSPPLKKLLSLYEQAKTNKYRFYSFGDAMFIF